MTTPTTGPEIGQIALVVSDVARARKFYTEAIGLAPLFDAGPHLSFLAAGSVRIMLTLPEGSGAGGRNSVLYFRTRSIEETYRVAVSRGASPDHEARMIARLPDHELWIAFVRDPDGNLVGFMEERRYPDFQRTHGQDTT